MINLRDIVAHLKTLDVDRETLIIFRDNGSDAPIIPEDNYGSSFPIKGKKGMYWEGGMRVPFIALGYPNSKHFKNYGLLHKTNRRLNGKYSRYLSHTCEINSIDIKDYTLEGHSLVKQFTAKEITKEPRNFKPLPSNTAQVILPRWLKKNGR